MLFLLIYAKGHCHVQYFDELSVEKEHLIAKKRVTANNYMEKSGIKISALVAIATGLGMTSCGECGDWKCQTMSGKVVSETSTTITIESDGRLLEMPKEVAKADNQKIFIEDSVVINYVDSAGVCIVKDVLLISHSQQMSNVMELFVGSWKVEEKETDVTFYSDLTTSSSKKWSINGRKMFILNGDDTQEYDIVSINDKQMVLCQNDKTYNLRRTE